MALTINTNVASLNAQRNLSKSQGALATAMARLSSGLRINSAKDDAAGLAISDRMTAQIRGLNQAARNANDGISLAQTAEGALQETTNILQRMRELAIQSANDTNSSADRISLQSEVNQLQQEMSRIASSTSFNNRNILNGDLNNAQFQVGANANETIAFSIPSALASDLGINILTSNNNLGIEAATSTGTPSFTIDGAGNVGSGGTDAAANLTIARDAAMLEDQTVTFGLNDDTLQTVSLTNIYTAASLTSQIDSNVTLANPTPTYAPNSVVVDINLDGASTWTTGNSVTLTIGTGAASQNFVIQYDATNGPTFATALAYAITNQPEAPNLTYSAEAVTGNLKISAANGANIELHDLKASGATVLNAVISGTSTATLTATGHEAYVQRTSVSYQFAPADGVESITSTGTALGVPAGEEGLFVSGVSDTAIGNNVEEQNLTIAGPDGSKPVLIEANSDAASIANKINLESAITGVTAEARTTATLFNLAANGTIGFTLASSNSDSPILISATVTADDLTALTQALNDQSGKTGITASLSGDKKSITLTQAEGYDIAISNYTHSNNDTSSTLTVLGSEGLGVILKGDESSTTNSTVVGGEVTFYSTGPFRVVSDIAGSAGSLFTSAPDTANSSDLDSIKVVDISTVQGANDAIKSIDGAISQIDSIRGELGAIQNRFESTISNLQNVSENLSAARSRVLDADIAQETSAMTKNNILQQAGVAILTQANQTPQLALQLLQG